MIIATISIAAIGYVSLSAFWFWICWVFVGAGLVATGCFGELYLFANPAEKGHESHHRWRELQFIAAVSIGVTMDFIGLFHDIPEAIRLEKDVATAYERASTNALQVEGLKLEASNAQLETARLERQIKETSSEVASQDPYKQPITALSATVSFQFMDQMLGALAIDGDSGILHELTFFNRTNKDFPKLIFISDNPKPPVPGDDPAHENRYFMSFNLKELRQNEGPGQATSPPSPHSIPIETIGRNVDFINGLDSVSFKLFIKTNHAAPPFDRRVLYDGKATLVANRTPKEFALSAITNPTNSPVILTGFPTPESK